MQVYQIPAKKAKKFSMSQNELIKFVTNPWKIPNDY